MKNPIKKQILSFVLVSRISVKLLLVISIIQFIAVANIYSQNVQPVHQFVEKPVQLPKAFKRDNSRATQSQALLLLLLGNIASKESETTMDKLLPKGDRLSLGIPDEMLSELNKTKINRTKETVLKEYLHESYDSYIRKPYVANNHMRLDDLRLHSNKEAFRNSTAFQHQLVERLFEKSDWRDVALLAAISLQHDDPLVRSSAALPYAALIKDEQCEKKDTIGCESAEARNQAILTLVQAIDESQEKNDELTLQVAATVLARLDPSHKRLTELSKEIEIKPGSEKGNTSVIVHGTWARGGEWWKPEGEFYEYINDITAGDLYDGDKLFYWSGGWSRKKRKAGSDKFINWVTNNTEGNVGVFAHSHGGNVAMLASKTLKYKRLVLLSCPVKKNEYMPNFNNIPKGEVYSIRTKADLVILADGSEQRFNDLRINECCLNFSWFGHFSTRKEKTWNKYHLEDFINNQGNKWEKHCECQ